MSIRSPNSPGVRELSKLPCWSRRKRPKPSVKCLIEKTFSGYEAGYDAISPSVLPASREKTGSLGVPASAAPALRGGTGGCGYLPTARAAIAFSTASFTADILELAAAYIGGNSIRVRAALATSCCTADSSASASGLTPNVETGA
jgi:hypothetical protein